MENRHSFLIPLVILTKITNIAHRFLSFLGLHLGAIFMILMTIAVLFQVVIRYVFSNPVSWIEEMCIYSMFFLTFLLAPYILLNKLHISMTLLYDRINKQELVFVVDILLNVVAIYGICTLIPSIFEVVYNNLNVTTTQMPLTKGQIYMIVPISFILMITIPLEQILLCLIKLLNK